MTHNMYISSMQELTVARLAELHSGIDLIQYTDFPDHANVGDSAIALGQLAFFKTAGIRINSIQSLNTYSQRIFSSHIAVGLHGGGNLGGLYPSFSEHRYRLAERLRQDTLLIQEPQSVHFVSDYAREDFRIRMATREHLRMAVRDAPSQQMISDLGVEAALVPDAVHALGRISSADPTEKVIVLARQDKESLGISLPSGVAAVDWISDNRQAALATWLRWRTRHTEITRTLSNPSPSRWNIKAEKRFERGVDLLSTGQVIITDRLHAMLIGMQMGRSVVAIDNNNRKLTSYAATWFGEISAPVHFATSFREALNIAQEIS